MFGDAADPSRYYEISDPDSSTSREVSYGEYMSEFKSLRGDESDWINFFDLDMYDWKQFYKDLLSDRWEGLNQGSDIKTVINDSEWIKKYTDYLISSGDERFDPEKYRTYLKYIDADDTPELIVQIYPFTEKERILAMTYKNDKYSVEEITGYPMYIPKGNSIYTDGYDGTKVLRIGKNEWEIIFNCIKDYSGDQYRFFVDGVSVSQDEYKEKLEKAKGSEEFDRYVEIIPQ